MSCRTLVGALAIAIISGTSLSAQEAAAPAGLKIHFALGDHRVSSDQQDLLDQAARLFRDGNPIVMIVAGSADTVGDSVYNLDLSIRRAQSVAIGLMDRGIPIERLQVLGRGNSELAIQTGDEVPNEENRSVTITWR